MKSIYKLAAVAMPLTMMVMASCSSNEPFSVAAPTDEPHILDPIFPDRVNGELPVVSNINRDANFKMNLTVTPSQSTEVTWTIDGETVAQGTTIDMPLLAGSYHLKVIASTTEGKSTYREGIINVNPLAGDPWSSAVSFERFVSPGAQAVLYGDNLDNVGGILIGQAQATGLNYNAEDGSLSYVVPQGLSNGTARVILLDQNNEQFGANTVTISSTPLVTAGFDRMTSGSTAVLTGINLDQVSSLSLGGNNVEIVSKSNGELQIACPALEDGEYPLTGNGTSGAVEFYVKGAVVDNVTVVVSSEQTLWSGHHYVSWDLDDSSPNKTFNLIPSDVFASIKQGSIISIHYSVEPSAEYHQLRTTTCWWTDLPGTGTVEFSEAGVVEVVLSADALSMIAEQGGFLCVGHGYYVDLVTLR